MTRRTREMLLLALLPAAFLRGVDGPRAALIWLAWFCLVEAFFTWARQRKAELLAEIEQRQRLQKAIDERLRSIEAEERWRAEQRAIDIERQRAEGSRDDVT